LARTEGHTLFCTTSIQANDAAVWEVGNWEMRETEIFEDGKEEGDLWEAVWSGG
jgi:hypothetical protein